MAHMTNLTVFSYRRMNVIGLHNLNHILVAAQTPFLVGPSHQAGVAGVNVVAGNTYSSLKWAMHRRPRWFQVVTLATKILGVGSLQVFELRGVRFVALIARAFLYRWMHDHRRSQV